MPAKGSTLKFANRNNIISKEFCNDLRKETGLDLDDATIRNIIVESNTEISNCVVTYDDGFKLPENLGYIVVTKYKSKNKPVDWVNSKRLRKKVLLTNLHSFGYVHHIKWYKNSLTNFQFREVYKLEPTRLLKRAVAKSIKEGKEYHIWSVDDFWSKNKILNRIYKN